MKIYEFEKDDIITRIEPSKPYPNLYGAPETDRAFLGKPYKFVGIANGCLYIKLHTEEITNKKTDEMDASSLLNFFTGYVSNRLINLPLDIWDDGWSHYIDPEKMFGDKEVVDDLSNLKKEELKKRLKKALNTESYEEAERIKKELLKYDKL